LAGFIGLRGTLGVEGVAGVAGVGGVAGMVQAEPEIPKSRIIQRVLAFGRRSATRNREGSGCIKEKAKQEEAACDALNHSHKKVKESRKINMTSPVFHGVSTFNTVNSATELRRESP
jgi:hypothetical protein